MEKLTLQEMKALYKVFLKGVDLPKKKSAWDAMIDGMYGDYPETGWDVEAFGY